MADGPRARRPPKPYMSGSAFMGVVELSRLLGASRDTVYGMIAAGKIPPCWIRVGQSQRWQRAHVEEWLRTGEWPAAARREGK